MPIKGLTDQPRQFTEIGQLRKGAPKPKNKQQPGADLTYFRATFEDGEEKAANMFYEAYGSEPREVNIRLPFNTMDENFDAWREAYVRGGLIHRCDGEYTQYEVDAQTGSILIMRGLDTDGNLVKCDGSTGCKPTGRLKVIVPELRRLAFMTALTTSVWDILNISRQLEAIRHVNNGKLQNVPLILKRRPREISTPSGTGGKRARREKWLLSIEADPAWVEARILALPTFDEPLQLPPGMPADANGDDGIEEQAHIGEIEKEKQETPIGLQVPRHMGELYMMAGKPPYDISKNDAINTLTTILSEEIGPGTSIKNALDQGITIEELWEKLIARCSQLPGEAKDETASDSVKKWNDFLESANITKEKALKILDAKSVNEWVKQGAGRNLDAAIQVIQEGLDWQKFLADYDLTEARAEKILGEPVEEWLHLNPGQSVIDEIVAVGDLDS